MKKTAAFVARNGIDGEMKFIQNQRENPKFAFLFPNSPHYPLYRFAAPPLLVL